MNSGQRITDKPLLENIPEGTSYLVEAGDGSGTKRVAHEMLVLEMEKSLPIGDMEELGELEKLEEPASKGRFTLVKAVLKVLGVATSAFKGTDGIKSGTAGMVPPPAPEDEGKVLGANGEWVSPVSGGSDIDAEKVKFADERDAEEKLGGIDGITEDLNCENPRIAASAAALNKLNDGLKFPDGTQFYADIQDGRLGFNTDPARGADTFHPFSGGDIVPLIPKMISDTQSESGEDVGTVIYDSESDTHFAWRAFDGIKNTSYNEPEWRSTKKIDTWIGYHFNTPKTVILIAVTNSNSQSDMYHVKKVKIQASNDGDFWIDLSEHTLSQYPAGGTDVLLINNLKPYAFYRLYVVEKYNPSYAAGINEIQMYGY